MTTAAAEKMEFQTEVNELLHLMIHSLYSHKEIFLRELISNASDAIDKLRFESLENADLLAEGSELEINIQLDEANKEIIISDNGIGMNREDLINNLGTIARSGTKKFMEAVSGDDKKDVALIGQFGVGFYSLFMVASKVVVTTKRADSEEAFSWMSEGTGSFELAETEKATRGTEIRISIKEESEEYLQQWQARNLITKYSEYVPHPIRLAWEESKEEGEGDDKKTTIESKNEVLNTKPAIWRRSKSDLDKEQYEEFFGHISHGQESLTYDHAKVEGTQEYYSLIYIPKTAPQGIQNREEKHGVKLYVRRVFIMDDCKDLLPTYLRFVSGVIDSEDLPLNVSREILQNNKSIDAMKKNITKKVLSSLKKVAKKDPEAYNAWWAELGNVLKEGFYMNWEFQDELKELVRFKSSETGKLTSMKEYVEAMKEDQKEIYFISAENETAALSNPHLEFFKDKGIPVLLFIDSIDEWVNQGLSEYDGKKLKNIASGDLDLGDLDKEDKAKSEEAKGTFEGLLGAIKSTLEKKLSDVRVSSRLKEAPSALVADAQGMSAHMEKLLRSHGQDVPESKRILEINTEHAISKQALELFTKDAKSAEAEDWMNFLYQQAVVSEGGEVDNPGEYTKLINKMISAKL
jgi:molecular chaperone HtpG